VTRRRSLSIAATALGLWAAGLLANPAPARAQDSCRSSCWTAYGHCYKATKSRERCQAQLQRCLDGCIRSRRR
jgi:hypothetical protein